MDKITLEREVPKQHEEVIVKDDDSTNLHDAEHGDEADMETIDRIYRYVNSVLLIRVEH